MKPQKENPHRLPPVQAESFATHSNPSEVKGDAMHNINIMLPSGNHATHGRAILGMLIRGDECDQYRYHELTGFPMADFRTRISELGNRDGWQIDREYHHTRDHNGQPQRCKHYWIDPEWLARVFESDPVLAARCKMLANSDHAEV